ncbi:hypothetical protein Rsub_10339 [Raphidocelis subcapitata]|uniref:Uncharacterized protein n=1 Tax=Raphidocelis subcapitata TaxID=307507 RepID=A0A2V0PDV7_9CHLO|nr:hypothetical protein Rsub_10339 [Raphidocelis subcapitata]|eukprot:GBF97152.1 hypothetical protein Rsub_10339 [Raphidocelis subcapitata]
MAAPHSLGDQAGMEYTRGGPDQADTRGATLVEKHNERMQTEKENLAVEKLSALMPSLGAKLRAHALAKTDWDVDAALALLRSFQVAQLEKLNAISKKRKRIQEDIQAAGEAAAAPPAAGASGSGSGSSGDSGSSGGESDGDSGGGRRSGKRKRSSKRDSKDKKSKSKKKRSKKEKKDKDKDKERERERRSKRSRSADVEARGKPHTTEFGKFGVIREADADRKRSEFMAWALDVKKLDVEALAKWEERELFKEFVEEFNTGSLPHRRYYDLAAYELSKAQEAAKTAAVKASARAGTRKAAEEGDEQELHRRRVEERQREQEKRVREAMEALRKGGMADEMRRQEMLRAEMALAYKTGDKAKAQRIMERLAPDDPAKKR